MGELGEVGLFGPAFSALDLDCWTDGPRLGDGHAVANASGPGGRRGGLYPQSTAFLIGEHDELIGGPTTALQPKHGEVGDEVAAFTAHAYSVPLMPGVCTQ